MMRIPLDRQSAVPLYRQIEDFISRQILTGKLAPAMRLPSTRELARSLGVNRITVNAAYAELEAQGLLSGRQGSGSYVSAGSASFPGIVNNELNNTKLPAWQRSLNEPGGPLPPPAQAPDAGLRNDPDAFRFADGTGDGRLFPVEEFRKTLQVVLCRDGRRALEYDGPGGYDPLRVTIARIMTSEGIPAHPDHVLITSGAQQAISLIARLLLRPGDRVLVENPTYAIALDLFRFLGAEIIGVELDEEGLRTDRLEELMTKRRPKLIYTIPNFQNPTGVCLSRGRRQALVDLASRFDVPVLEDDYVGDLRYDGHDLPALKTLDVHGGVIYVRTFSKMLMPGLRVGFILAQGPVLRRLEACKRVTDLASSSLIQRALEAYITVGRYHAQLRRACRTYRRRRDRMLTALADRLPGGVRWQLPAGGLFVWLELPSSLSSAGVARRAAEQGVALVPSARFFIDGRDHPFLRLNFAGLTEEKIEAGIERLGEVLRRCLRSSGRPGSKE
jgi:GntR family transcriptional regulator/MocR family aminotransferase